MPTYLHSLYIDLTTDNASADTGSKASVRINFENMGDELCYGTLLSKKQAPDQTARGMVMRITSITS